MARNTNTYLCTTSTSDRVIRQWMAIEAHHYIDNQTGESDPTGLAEAAASEFGFDYHGGPLDEDTHPIWGWAIEAFAER